MTSFLLKVHSLPPRETSYTDHHHLISLKDIFAKELLLNRANLRGLDRCALFSQAEINSPSKELKASAEMWRQDVSQVSVTYPSIDDTHSRTRVESSMENVPILVALSDANKTKTGSESAGRR